MKIQSSTPKVFKILLLGNGGSGKTTLRKNYFDKPFKENYQMTIGADLAVKKLENNCIIQIWDLAGQKNFEVIRSSYYIDAHGALLVFSLIDEQSLKDLTSWLDEVDKHAGRMKPIIIVGNKTDLVNKSKYSIPEEKIWTKLDEISKLYKKEFKYVQSSALTGENVNKMFNDLVDEIIRT